LTASTILLALGLSASAGLARPHQPFAPGDPRRAKVRGGLPVAFGDRPAADGSRRRLPAAEVVPVVISYVSRPTPEDAQQLAALGLRVERGDDGQALFAGVSLAAQLTAAQLPAVVALPRVTGIALDGPPFGAPRPLDGTGAEI